MAAFTFERLIVVRYPLRRQQICTVRRAKLIIFAMAVVVSIVQILSLFTTELEEKKNEKGESYLPSYHSNQFMRVITMLETVFTLVVPPVLTAIMNALIIKELFKFKRTFQSGANRHQNSTYSSHPLQAAAAVVAERPGSNAIEVLFCNVHLPNNNIKMCLNNEDANSPSYYYC